MDCPKELTMVYLRQQMDCVSVLGINVYIAKKHVSKCMYKIKGLQIWKQTIEHKLLVIIKTFLPSLL